MISLSRYYLQICLVWRKWFGIVDAIDRSPELETHDSIRSSVKVSKYPLPFMDIDTLYFKGFGYSQLMWNESDSFPLTPVLIYYNHTWPVMNYHPLDFVFHCTVIVQIMFLMVRVARVIDSRRHNFSYCCVLRTLPLWDHRSSLRQDVER